MNTSMVSRLSCCSDQSYNFESYMLLQYVFVQSSVRTSMTTANDQKKQHTEKQAASDDKQLHIRLFAPVYSTLSTQHKFAADQKVRRSNDWL